MAYDLTPEALAFIAAQEPRHITNNARYLARSFETADEQLEALQYAVALRKQNKGLLWRDREVVAMRNRAWKRRTEEKRTAARLNAEGAARRSGGYPR
jgi:hypothetical protein